MNDFSTKNKKDVFFTVYPFMTQELNLRLNVLEVYALLFSYTMKGKGMYYGTIKSFAESIHVSRRTVHRHLKLLFERGLIENVISEDGKRSGIRCTFVHEGERSENKGSSNGDGGFVFTEEQKTKALDNLVRKTYGKLDKKMHLAIRAAVRDNLERKAKERELNEVLSRVVASAKADCPR